MLGGQLSVVRFEVILLNPALKFYEQCPEDLAKRLNKCFEDLEQNPFYGLNIKLLRTAKSMRIYRYRVGDYRVIYGINKVDKKVGVHLILPRSRSYRDF